MKPTTDIRSQSVAIATEAMEEVLRPNPMKGKSTQELLEVIAHQLTLMNTAYQDSQKEVLTPEEAMNYLNLPKSTLYQLTMRKEIPHYKRGKALYFNKEELKEWLFSHRVETKAEIEARASKHVRTNPRYKH